MTCRDDPGQIRVQSSSGDTTGTIHATSKVERTGEPIQKNTPKKNPQWGHLAMDKIWPESKETDKVW
ncbi:hypothetical protein SAMN04515617_11858 [Collimonas sp. OK242]|jgi:hypothetical protein|nr:hypothetical protein SAMN04515617_11858 [Collimonas sp. OK242]